jgi:hypothetical protein
MILLYSVTKQEMSETRSLAQTKTFYLYFRVIIQLIVIKYIDGRFSILLQT